MIIIDEMFLINFGKFQMNTFHFSNGVNLICGSNSSGKTTLIKALEVGLWGGKRGHLSTNDLINNRSSQAQIWLRYFQSGVKRNHYWNFKRLGNTIFLLDGNRQGILNQRQMISQIIKDRGFYRDVVSVPQVNRFNLIDKWKEVSSFFLESPEEPIKSTIVLKNGKALNSRYKDELKEKNKRLIEISERLHRIEASDKKAERVSSELIKLEQLIDEAVYKEKEIGNEIQRIQSYQKERNRRVSEKRAVENQLSSITDDLRKIEGVSLPISFIIRNLFKKINEISEYRAPIISKTFLTDVISISSTGKEAIETKTKELQINRTVLEKKLNQMYNSQSVISSELERIKIAREGIMESDERCLTCDQKLSSVHKDERMKHLENEFKKSIKLKTEIQRELDGLQKEKTDLELSIERYRHLSQYIGKLHNFLIGYKTSKVNVLDEDLAKRDLNSFDNAETEYRKLFNQEKELKERIKKMKERRNELLQKPRMIVVDNPIFEKDIMSLKNEISILDSKQNLIQRFNEIFSKFNEESTTDKLDYIHIKTNEFLKDAKSNIHLEKLSIREIIIKEKDKYIPKGHLAASERELVNFVLRLSLYFYQKRPQILIVDEPGVYVDLQNYKYIAHLIESLSSKIPQLFIFIRPEFQKFYSVEPVYDLDKI